MLENANLPIAKSFGFSRAKQTRIGLLRRRGEKARNSYVISHTVPPGVSNLLLRKTVPGAGQYHETRLVFFIIAYRVRRTRI